MAKPVMWLYRPLRGQIHASHTPYSLKAPLYYFIRDFQNRIYILNITFAEFNIVLE